jgi:hypothetical protein
VLNQLVFMTYLEARHGVSWWTNLESATQATLIVVLALLVGYTLDSLNFILLGLFESRVLRSAWWGRLMVAWQQSREQSLEASLIQPTALGNQITDGKKRASNRYRIDVANLWPHLMSVLSEKGYAAQVEREKAAFDFFLNLSVLSTVFVVECVLARALLGWPGLALVPWAALGMAYVFYRLAVPSADKWYDWINAAFDLYRYQLAERLALKPFENANKELERWWGLSRFIQGEQDTFDGLDYTLPKPKATQQNASSE